MRVVKRICMLALGFVLFVAGLLKLMDPVGAGLQMEAYFQFFHLSFLAPLSEVAAVVFALFETILGVAVITGIRRGPVGRISLILLSFFTLLTFVIWIANPDMECGCFGEAIHMTHSQSLVKNLVLMVLWAIAFLPYETLEDSPRIKYVSFWITSVSSVVFLFYSLTDIPLIDYTSLKPGTELDGASSVSLIDGSGEYCDSLLTAGRAVVISVYAPDRLDESEWSGLDEFASVVRDAGMKPILAVSGDPEELSLKSAVLADHRTLMTLNRSNGGATYIADGQVIKKWSSRSLPDRDDLDILASGNPLEAMISANEPERLKMQGFLLYVFAVMLLL